MGETLKLLKEITSLPGISGFEQEVRKFIREEMKAYANISSDRLGSLICEKTGSSKSPKIMLSGHMDEVGFMVKRITDEGFITFTTIGGWWSQVMLGQRVQIHSQGKIIEGLIGSKPPHVLSAQERSKLVEIEDMFIDVGASDKESAIKMGVRPGDPIVPYAEFVTMNGTDNLMAKAWDDRLGCALFMQTIKELANKEHPNTIYGVGSVQEEVGLRGARTSAQMIKPDVAIAFDVSVAGDMPGVKIDKAQSKLNKGPVILLFDRSMIPNNKFRDFVVQVAEEAKIPYQFDLMEGGGTDAGAIHLVESGVPSLVIAIPTRYIHSHYGIINRHDYDNTLKLVMELMLRLDEKTVASFSED